ncbi:MAG: hypothetical protein AAF961_14975, partial [Planctomycetota bacterium]
MTHAGLRSALRARPVAAFGRYERTLFAVTALASISWCVASHAAENKYWDVSPYAVHLSLAVDDARRPGVVSESDLAEAITQRVDASVRPLWSFVLASGDAAPLTENLAAGPLAWEDLPPSLRQYDKVMRLSVEATAIGFRLSCDEYDVYTRRSGPLHERTVRQPLILAEQCFQLVRDCFSPLAIVESLRDEKDRVRLTFKGAALPQVSGDPLASAFDKPYQPVLRRTNRSGELRTGGLVDLPWTLLQIEDQADDGWTARVDSGINRPFGVRRRGLVEQLAIAVSRPLQSTDVRLHARTDRKQALAGYEVFARPSPEVAPALVGVSDSRGIARIPAALGPVTTLFSRSEGQLLAKVPVAPGSTQ